MDPTSRSARPYRLARKTYLVHRDHPEQSSVGGSPSGIRDPRRWSGCGASPLTVAPSLSAAHRTRTVDVRRTAWASRPFSSSKPPRLEQVPVRSLISCWPLRSTEPPPSRRGPPLTFALPWARVCGRRLPAVAQQVHHSLGDGLSPQLSVHPRPRLRPHLSSPSSPTPSPLRSHTTSQACARVCTPSRARAPPAQAPSALLATSPFVARQSHASHLSFRSHSIRVFTRPPAGAKASPRLQPCDAASRLAAASLLSLYAEKEPSMHECARAPGLQLWPTCRRCL